MVLWQEVNPESNYLAFVDNELLINICKDEINYNLLGTFTLWKGNA